MQPAKRCESIQERYLGDLALIIGARPLADLSLAPYSPAGEETLVPEP